MFAGFQRQPNPSKDMQLPFPTLPILAVALLLGSISPSTGAESTLIAFGRVDATGGITRFHTTVDATVSGMGFTNGRCVIEVERENAFVGYTVDEIVVHTTLNSSVSYATNVIASINDLTDHKISVDVRMSNVEDSTDPNSYLLEDCPFFFAIHRIPGSYEIPATSPHLFASGRIGNFGALTSHISIPDCEMTTDWQANGNIEMTFTKPGAFADDDGSDYVVLATPYSNGSQDRLVRVYTSDFSTDDSVSIRVRTFDAQDETNDDALVAVNETVYFTIYRVPNEHTVSEYRSNLILGMGRLDGSNAQIIGKASSLPGGDIVGIHAGTGEYHIYITSDEPFATNGAGDFTMQLSIDHHQNIDELVSGRIVVLNAFTLCIEAYVDDVEQSGSNTGIPTNRNVTFLLYSSAPALQSDMQIGKKRHLSRMRGNDRYNTNASGQRIRTKIRGARGKYFFAVQNDGEVHDSLTVRRAGKFRKVKPRILRLTGGRANVTAQVKSSGYTAADLESGEAILFKTKVKLRGDQRRSKIRLQTTSKRGGDADSSLAKVIRGK